MQRRLESYQRNKQWKTEKRMISPTHTDVLLLHRQWHSTSINWTSTSSHRPTGPASLLLCVRRPIEVQTTNISFHFTTATVFQKFRREKEFYFRSTLYWARNEQKDSLIVFYEEFSLRELFFHRSLVLFCLLARRAFQMCQVSVCVRQPCSSRTLALCAPFDRVPVCIRCAVRVCI